MDWMIQSDSVSKTSCYCSLSFKPHQQFPQLYFSFKKKKVVCWSKIWPFFVIYESISLSFTVRVSVLTDRRGVGFLTLIIRERSPASASSRTMFSSLSSINDAWYFITLGWFNCCEREKKTENLPVTLINEATPRNILFSMLPIAFIEKKKPFALSTKMNPYLKCIFK